LIDMVFGMMVCYSKPADVERELSFQKLIRKRKSKHI